MLIQERIKLIIKANNETPSSFADKIGVKRSNLSHVLNGRNKPSLDFLEKIISTYPNVNASWLITGVTREGAMEEQGKQEGLHVSDDDLAIDHIMIIYKDGTFKRYKPKG